MATITRYVNTGSTAGGNGTTNATSGANRAYASLNEAESAEQTNLVTATNNLEIICGGGSDTTDVAFSGWTTSSSYYVTVKCTTDKHNGTSRDVSGSGYMISSAGAGTIRIAIDYITIDGLDIKDSTTGISPLQLYSCKTITVQNCIVHNGSGSSSSYVFSATLAGLTVNWYNNVLYGGSRCWDTRGATAINARYSTFWRHADQLGLVSGSELNIKNCYVGKTSGSSEDYWSGGSPTGNNNASSDTTATARFTSSYNSKAGSSQFTSVTAGSENFSLKSGNGLDGLAATGTGITTDIIGTSRDASTPDIGAFEYVTASSTPKSIESDLIIFN